MLDRIFQLLAPHSCYSCGKTGQTLCDNCKYDITQEPFFGCIVCCGATAPDGVCRGCKTEYERAWAVAERTAAIEQLIDGYKFSHQKASSRVLVELLDEVLPDFSPYSPTVVPIPTIAQHIRMRGYDHVALVAKAFAARRQIRYAPLLSRQTTTKQIGASRRQRFENAKHAFGCHATISEDAPILLIDDIFTTGATLTYAAKALKEAGASTVWAAVLARQPLDHKE